MMEDEGTMVVSSLQPSVTLTRKEREKERERRGRGEGEGVALHIIIVIQAQHFSNFKLLACVTYQISAHC